MKKGETAKLILLEAATSGGAIPFTTPLARIYRRQDKYGKYRIRKTFAELKRKGLIEVTENPDGKTEVTLTEAGKRKVLEYQFEDLKIAPLKKWDKKWRMVIFDIPEPSKKSREALRYKLRELGFHQLQKSVFIHPYECRNEIEFIVGLLDISPYVKMAEVSRFDGDDLIRRDFRL